MIQDSGNQFLAISEMNFEFKSQIMVFSTCENIRGSFESLRGRFHRNGRTRPIGRLGVTFLIGRLGVNQLPVVTRILVSWW